MRAAKRRAVTSLLPPAANDGRPVQRQEVALRRCDGHAGAGMGVDHRRHLRPRLVDRAMDHMTGLVDPVSGVRLQTIFLSTLILRPLSKPANTGRGWRRLQQPHAANPSRSFGVGRQVQPNADRPVAYLAPLYNNRVRVERLWASSTLEHRAKLSRRQSLRENRLVPRRPPYLTTALNRLGPENGRTRATRHHVMTM
jgi:hypothetical protein